MPSNLAGKPLLWISVGVNLGLNDRRCTASYSPGSRTETPSANRDRPLQRGHGPLCRNYGMVYSFGRRRFVRRTVRAQSRFQIGCVTGSSREVEPVSDSLIGVPRIEEASCSSRAVSRPDSRRRRGSSRTAAWYWRLTGRSTSIPRFEFGAKLDDVIRFGKLAGDRRSERLRVRRFLRPECPSPGRHSTQRHGAADPDSAARERPRRSSRSRTSTTTS